MYLYENAIIDDINNLFTNSNVTAVIADNLDEGLRRIAAKNNDKVSLPFVMLTGGDWNIKETNFYNLMHGTKVRNKENSQTEISNIPIQPEYTMYIAAQSSKECDMLTREIIFYYFQNPTLTVNIPYGINTIHTFNVIFNPNVRKTTRASGLVYRTLSFYLDGAYLWHNNTFNLVKEIDINKVETKLEEDKKNV